MNGEQMSQMTRFAVALSRMAQAVKQGAGVTLDADETAAMVATVQVLAARAKEEA